MRFLMLFGIVLSLSISVANADSPPISGLWSRGGRCAAALDFPYSPVRLVVLTVLSDDAGARTDDRRTARLASAYMISLMIACDLRGDHPRRPLASAAPRLQRLAQPAHL
jgi:hypothetical protein